jgi:hypothetical protein
LIPAAIPTGMLNVCSAEFSDLEFGLKTDLQFHLL